MNRPHLPRHLLVLLCATSCSTSLEIPDSTRITCASDADCFNGRRCLIDIRECVDPLQSCVVEVPGGFGSVANGTACTQRTGASGVCLSGQCLTSSCGDGFLDPSTGEECDRGAQNSDSAPNACRANCRDPHCGDGVLDDGKEVCDDGNTTSGDGCRADCKKVEVCNDAVVDAGEACDDANDNPNDGCDACAATSWVPEIMVGRGSLGSTPATVTLASAGALIADLDRRLYAADNVLCRILRIDTANDSVSVVAGSGSCGSGALQGQIARGSDIGGVRALAIHPDGSLYFADGVFIRRIDPVTGRLSTIAGNGNVCPSPGTSCPSGSVATAIPVASIRDMDFDAAGNLYYTDSLHVVRAITPSGSSYVLLGTAGTAGNALPAGATGGDVLLDEPSGIAVAPDGVVYVADTANHRIVRYDVLNDEASSVAGTGIQGVSPDGSVAAASPIRFSGNLADLERRVTGELVFAEQNRLRTIDRNGILGTIGGTGASASSGDGGPAVSAAMSPGKLAAIDGGGIAFTETLSGLTPSLKIRLIESGIIRSVVSTVASGVLVLGQAHTATPLPSMKSFDVAANGDVYVSSSSPAVLLRATMATGVVELIAGGGSESTPDGIPGTQARFSLTTTLRVRPNGDVVLVDSYGHAIYRVDGATRIVDRIAGTGTAGYGGDGGLARDARINNPCDADFASNGDMYILDCGNFRIRKVDAASGNITTVAGTGAVCSTSTCGDGGSPLAATFGEVDPQLQRGTIRVIDDGATIVFSDRGLLRVRMISGAPATIQTIAGSGASCSVGYNACGDDGPGSAATFSVLGGIALDGGGLLIADSRLRRLDALSPSAIIRPVAINTSSFLGDGGDALTAGAVGGGTVQRTADGIFLHSSGPTPSSLTIRKIVNGKITTVAGLVDAAGDGPIATSELTHPVAMTAIAANRWLIADGEPGRVRLLDTERGWVSSVVGYPFGFVEASLPDARARYLQLLANPSGITVDAARRTAYVVEEGADRIRELDITDAVGAWTVGTYAGGERGHADGPVATARFDHPRGAAYDATRDILWVADAGNHVIRRIDVAAGQVSTLAGQPQLRGFAGDGRGAAEAYFNYPSALAVDPVDGSLYVADTGNNRVRRIIADVSGELSSASIVETVLGDGSASASGSGIPARAFPAQQPNGLAFDRYGDLLVTTTSSVRIVNAGSDGVPSGEDFVQTVYGAPPRDSFPENVTTCLTGIASPDGDGSLYVLDGCLGYVLRLTRQALP